MVEPSVPPQDDDNVLGPFYVTAASGRERRRGKYELALVPCVACVPLLICVVYVSKHCVGMNKFLHCSVMSSVCMYLCLCVYLYLCMYIYVCVYLYLCMYQYMCVYLYRCTYLHACSLHPVGSFDDHSCVNGLVVFNTQLNTHTCVRSPSKIAGVQTCTHTPIHAHNHPCMDSHMHSHMHTQTQSLKYNVSLYIFTILTYPL